MFKFLLIVQTLVAASLVGVILMQRSEGGGTRGGRQLVRLHDGARRGRLPDPLHGNPRRPLHHAVHRACRDCRRYARADQGRYFACQPGRSGADHGTRNAATAACAADAKSEPAGGSARSVTAPKPDLFHRAGCAVASFAPKPQLPWRGLFLSPAAWSHRLVRVFYQPLSGRCFRRVATRSASGSSTPI